MFWCPQHNRWEQEAGTGGPQSGGPSSGPGQGAPPMMAQGAAPMMTQGAQRAASRRNANLSAVLARVGGQLGGAQGGPRVGMPGDYTVMPGGMTQLTPPGPSSSIMPGGSPSAPSFASVPSGPTSYSTPVTPTTPTYTWSPPAPAPRAVPTGAAEASFSGAPAWYTQANAVVNDALLQALGVIVRDPASENARDVFYVDRMTEFLRTWADELQKRVAPLRKAPPFH